MTAKTSIPKKITEPVQRAAEPIVIEEKTKTVSVPNVTSAPEGKERSHAQIEQWIHESTTDENISSIKTLSELEKSVEMKQKPVSLLLFYGRYCPYSKRTVPGLRQWARFNQDRIHLYEVDVEEGAELTEYYHVRTIPTVMAFNETNLLAPVWQRTANQVLASDLPTAVHETPTIEAEKMIESTMDAVPGDEIFRGRLNPSMNMCLLIDPSLKGAERIFNINETKNRDGEEQYLVIRNDPSTPSRFIVAITSCISLNSNETHTWPFV